MKPRTLSAIVTQTTTTVHASKKLLPRRAAQLLARRTPWICTRCASNAARQWSTPLAKNLAEAITTTGPVPIAAYMRQCLTSPEGGYYTSRTEGRDQFGQKGDFITSPEISQVFGELLGIWIVAEWMAQGKKPGVQIVELGPGRGTLMDDILRTLRNFKPLASSIEAVYLVEASPSLRRTQKELLCGQAPLEEIDIGFRSKSKSMPDVPIIWTEDVRFLPKDNNKTPFIVAHEFFDALPIHAFQAVPSSTANSQSQTTRSTVTTKPKVRTSASQNEWRELLVSPTPPSSTQTTLSIPQSQRSSSFSLPEFQLILTKASTPHSLYLPTISERYKALLPTAGATIEISPEAQVYASTIAQMIGGSSASPKFTPSGAALILDYGTTNTVPINSLRGIKAHRSVSPFSQPGLVDISADVDFLALAEAAINASEGVEVHGPVEQAAFLEAMGIKERAEQLMKKAARGEGGKEDGYEVEKTKRIESGWKRLVDRGRGGMGKVYKAMAIVPHMPGVKRRPVGFGGDVVG